MVRTGALLRRAPERRRLPDMVVMKAREDRRGALEHAPGGSTSTPLSSVAFVRAEPDPAASTSLKRCSVVVEAVLRGAAVVGTSKRSSKHLWKKRIEVDAARYKCR